MTEDRVSTTHAGRSLAVDGRWSGDRDSLRRQIAVIEDEASEQPAPPIDVERLTKVLAEHFGPSYFPGMTDVTIHGKTPEAIAEQIAAEYARLGSAPSESEPKLPWLDTLRRTAEND